ncbi:Uncharacterised protein [Mycobacterium tuberculosis]|uniref:Uncharacterized protein n=1 Tax=Mycobacterium tuberculosis TaxID=1773 RepID=A0A0U0RI88_MYCTX|nr:Uncharacterised protein [Mycobacterium tuberculosis]COZ76167.1 Uncharacterised protein [Mycobacterium tuberculosis]CPA94044.1 Uncharacterised protein [Mycobacterium tuberculosis]
MTSSPAWRASAWVSSSSITKQALPPGPLFLMNSSVSGSRSRWLHTSPMPSKSLRSRRRGTNTRECSPSKES